MTLKGGDAVKAGIYARLSMLKSTEELTEAALERQEADCRALCDRRGWSVLRVYPDEGFSAFQRRRKRPAFEEALKDLETGVIDVLVCWRLDRLVRRLHDWVRIEEVVERSGGTLVSVNEGEQSQLTLRILASIAEQESSNTSKRVEAQQRQAAFKGRPPHGGQRLFGYTKGRTEIIEEEAAVLREVVERILRGESVRSVTLWANTVSTSTTGKPWQHATIRGTLLSPGIAGLRGYHGEVVAEGVWPPIIPREKWERLCVVLKDPDRVSKAGRPGRFLLSGLARCGYCEQTLVAHYRPKSRGGGREYLCLTHPGTKRCGKCSVTAMALEQIVEEIVLQELAEGRVERALAAQGGRITELDQQRQMLRAKRREVGSMYDANEIDKAEYLERRAALTAKLEAVQAQLEREYSKTALSELPTAEDELRGWWTAETTTIDQKRTILKACLTSVLVGPGSKRGGPRFNADRLLPPYGPQWRI
jgi:site-specific DNA recombinase